MPPQNPITAAHKIRYSVTQHREALGRAQSYKRCRTY